jgi:hypothetical protein
MTLSTKIIFALAAFATVLTGPAFAQRTQKAHQTTHRQTSHAAAPFTQWIMQELVNEVARGGWDGPGYGANPDFQSGSEKN